MNAAPIAVRLGRRMHIIQGECQVSADPEVVLLTMLGSCVAACICDPVAEVGGMNHFLLPDSDDHSDADSLRYGAYAMELLVNRLLTLGARRGRLEAKLFGGASLTKGLTDVGTRNVAFAQAYLRREGIQFQGGSTDGSHARRLQYWPVSGRARQLVLSRIVDAQPILPARDRDGTVEFF
jgi:chemotaxis protein CheD